MFQRYVGVQRYARRTKGPRSEPWSSTHKKSAAAELNCCLTLTRRMASASPDKTFCATSVPALQQSVLPKLLLRRSDRNLYEPLFVSQGGIRSFRHSRYHARPIHCAWLTVLACMQEVAEAAEAAKENSGDAIRDRGVQQKASWHRATGAVAKPQPPRQITPCQAPAPSAAAHSAASTGPALPISTAQPRVCARLPLTAVSTNLTAVPYQTISACSERPVQMLRTPSLRTKATASDAAKEVPGRLGGGLPSAARDAGNAPPAPAVPADLRHVGGKRKFVPPRSAS